ncbi:MAG: LruC domain-containing protein [Bacteroidia bacterium]|nr:LruC domain-containing protein [Bacteroidia bacterium]
MKKIIVFSSIVIFLFLSCKKSLTPPSKEVVGPDLTQNVKNINEMVVPDGFIYSGFHSVDIKVLVDNNVFGNQLQRIEVYDGNPYSTGSLIASGSAKFSEPFEARVNIKNALDVLYIVKVNPDKSSSMQIVNAKLNSILVDGLGKGNSGLGKSAPASPNCNTGCTSTVTGNTTVNVNNVNDVVCIIGNFSGSININNGTVRICGNANISSLNLNNSSQLLIASGAVVNASNVSLNTATSSITNWSNSFFISGGFSPNGMVKNYALISVTGDMSINGNSDVLNDGTLNITGTLNCNKTLTNNGTISIGTDFNQNGGGVFVNNCRFTVGRNANLNNPITNRSYIRVNQNTTVNSGGTMNLFASSMFSTSNITFNGPAIGNGGALIKVSGTTVINGGGNLSGALQFCDANGIETNFGTIGGTVSLLCDMYVPTSPCNPEGNGTPAIVDTDQDGVADEIDDYPNDAKLAFNNFYPNAKEMATAAFEDLWPSKGDYDLNDLVIDFRHNIITNANNEIVKYEGEYKLRASGGAQQIAFCMAMPFDPTSIEKMDGATIETEHKKLVFQLFDNSKKELGGWNTVPSQVAVPAKDYRVTFELSKNIDLKEFGGVGAFDPFIWMNEKDKGRGYEIHVAGNPPTELADTKLFGYANDDTRLEKEKYYLTANNLPWGIIVPESFSYCVELSLLELKEKPDVTQAYLKFAQWAQSGGELYKDWYKDMPGYRNYEYFYEK